MNPFTSKIMSAVKSKNTKPEIKLRRVLWSRGLRYRVNLKTQLGKPDLVFPRAKLAVFCDGDFWHGHNWVIRGLSSLEEELERYTVDWREKITNNIRRDKRQTYQLKTQGWTVLRLWESEIKADVSRCADRVEKAYQRGLDKQAKAKEAKDKQAKDKQAQS